MFIVVCAWLCVHLFKVVVPNLECLQVRKNDLMHDNEIRDTMLNIDVYGVEISGIGLGDLS